MTDDIEEIRTEFKRCKKYATKYGRLEVLDELEKWALEYYKYLVKKKKELPEDYRYWEGKRESMQVVMGEIDSMREKK